VITLKLNGELVDVDPDVLFSALDSIGLADEGGVEVVNAPKGIREEIEARLNQKVDDEDVWLMI
jgi:hypothetical protein